MDTKECKACKTVKTIDKFNKDSSAYDGIRTKCKDCQRKVNRAYDLKNSDKRKAYQKTRYKHMTELPKDIKYYVNEGLWRLCYRCKVAKPREEFSKYSGVKTICDICRKD